MNTNIFSVFSRLLNVVRQNLLVPGVFLLGLLIRLALMPFGNHGDLLSLVGWGRQMYLHGLRGFYENSIWIYSGPTQAPLFNLTLALNYYLYEKSIAFLLLTKNIFKFFPPASWIWWWEKTLFPPTEFLFGAIITIKFIPVIADILLAALIFLIGRKIISARKALFTSTLFLFLPFGWYLSSLWGQYDQVIAFLTLGSFLALYKKRFLLSVLLLFIAGQLKPTAAFFIPFYVFYYLYQRPGFKTILVSIIGFIAVFWLVTSPFADKDPFTYTFKTIYPKVFMDDRWLLANHAFNFWQFLIPQWARADMPILGVPAFSWGSLLLIIIYIWSAILILEKNSFKNLMIGFYLVAAGSYLFFIGQLDRYFFPAVVALAILTFYYPKLLRWWIITVFLFSINLYYSWGFPGLTDYKNWRDYNIIRFFSLAQVVTFFVCLQKMDAFKVWRILKFRQPRGK